MKACLAEGLEAGAVGLSTGLYFAPGAFASEQELVELASIAGRHGTVVTSHIRDEGSRSVGFIPAVREILRIGRDARVPVHISHIMIGSDGSSLSTEGPLSRGNPHPRNISQPQTKEAAGWRPLADQVRALGPFAALSGSGESARPRP